MKKVNFITAYAPDDRGGGWNGVNAHLYENLRRHFEVVYVGPINPGPCQITRLISRLKKRFGLPREFYHYARRRLDRISQQVRAQADPGAAFDFHHGAAPWSACGSPRPYGGYIDASFDTYISLYHHRPAFARADIRRICSQETQWLARAAAVFCASEWTLRQTVDTYGLRRPPRGDHEGLILCSSPGILRGREAFCARKLSRTSTRSIPRRP